MGLTINCQYMGREKVDRQKILDHFLVSSRNEGNLKFQRKYTQFQFWKRYSTLILLRLNIWGKINNLKTNDTGIYL